MKLFWNLLKQFIVRCHFEIQDDCNENLIQPYILFQGTYVMDYIHTSISNRLWIFGTLFVFNYISIQTLLYYHKYILPQECVISMNKLDFLKDLNGDGVIYTMERWCFLSIWNGMEIPERYNNSKILFHRWDTACSNGYMDHKTITKSQ